MAKKRSEKPKALVDFRFDAVSSHALAAASAVKTKKLVTGVSEETRRNIRNLVTKSIREGIPPYDAARAIRSMVGLTAAQGQAAFSYRQTLINQGLTLEKVNAKVDRYADKLLRSRADRIARTEVMSALNAGQAEAWNQAQREGFLSEGAMKEWIVTPDELLCPECEAMDGRTVPVAEEFPDGDPPLHPSCRCTLGISTP